MARRSVSLPPDLERAVRLLQARLLTAIDRDISFNETLNLALAAGFSVPGLAKVIDEDRWSALLDGSEWQSNGTISDAGKQVLEAIAPPAARRHARSKTPSETAQKRSQTKVAPREKILFDSISDAPESPRAAPGDGVAVDDGVAATQVAADISI